MPARVTHIIGEDHKSVAPHLAADTLAREGVSERVSEKVSACVRVSVSDRVSQ